jgi:hypothetical protein
MNPSPFLAEQRESVIERLANPGNGPTREAIVLSKRHWPSRAVQIEDRFVAAAEHMHVGRNMIRGVDNRAEAVESQNGRHPVL